MEQKYFNEIKFFYITLRQKCHEFTLEEKLKFIEFLNKETYKFVLSLLENKK